MDELLKKLFEAEVLSDDTRKELSEAFETKINEAVEEARHEAEIQVRAELTEQWVNERDAIVEAIDTQVTEFLKAEMQELKEDIESFRDLEVEFAEKLVAERASMAQQLKADMETLVEGIDAFIAEEVAKELEELKEDIQQVKKLEFGRQIFEAVAQTFENRFVDPNSLKGKLDEAQTELAALKEQQTKILAEKAKIEREHKIAQLLAPLSGSKREIMETILTSVATEKLDESFDKHIGRVLVESTNHSKEKEKKVLKEGSGEQKAPVTENVKIVTGDVQQTAAEKAAITKLDESSAEALRKLAGVK